MAEKTGKKKKAESAAEVRLAKSADVLRALKDGEAAMENHELLVICSAALALATGQRVRIEFY